ncbi:MAG: heat shock protein HtpX [Francisellaceae bacterium]|jgi:heat shock protein HtpX
MNLDLQYGKRVDWRQTVKNNRRKTYIVIVSFLVIFFVLGILIDLIWRYNTGGAVTYSQYYQTQVYTQMPIGELAFKLATFQIIPWATILCTLVAFVWILSTFSFYDKIMLAGTEYEEITAQNSNPVARKLYNIVEEMKIAANMQYMPKVYLIHANYMNAFASGYSEKSAMVAVTTALISRLDRSELQAVMAHELTHIRNQDIKLNLFTVVLSNMLMFMMEISFFSLLFSGGSRRDSRGNNNNNIMTIIFIVVMVLRFVLPIITTMLMLFLSRTREYMADAGAVELMRDNQPMASALVKINQGHTDPAVAQEYKDQGHEQLRRASYIYDPSSALSAGEKSSDFMSTHPSLTKRLAAIGIKLK